MSKTNYFENKVLELLFQNIGIPDVGDATGLPASAADGSVYVSLFTGSPTEDGSLGLEATYTGYARKDVTRNNTQWIVADGSATNANAITFNAATGGSDTVTHFGIHLIPDGSALMYGALTSSLAISNGITPEFAAGDLDIIED